MRKRFFKDRCGNIAVPAAIAFLGTATLIGGLMDYMTVSNQQVELQKLADAAALNAVREFALTTDNPDRVEFVASAYVASVGDDPSITSSPEADADNRRMKITLTAPVNARFPGPFTRMGTVTVTAEAELLGNQGNVCMIGLDQTANKTLILDKRSRITADECSIFSNSTHSAGTKIHVQSSVKADMVCIAGGLSGNANQVDGEVVTDCQPLPDPLSGRPKPFDNSGLDSVDLIAGNYMTEAEREANGCDHFATTVGTGQDVILNPGVYCGGISVTGGKATLNPGVYVIKDGSLTVSNGGELTGQYAGFFLTGTLSAIDFTGNSTISLTAPKDGVMTGMLFYEDPDTPVSTYHTISSDDARRMVGTIYLPQSKLRIAGEEPIADQSEYTIVVARQFELDEGPNLVLKTDYALSDIPVPEGVGPLKGMDARIVN
ncbi:MAG: TadE/TadG family type IV pilus assembly protein [Pseudomonadota bacterium]